MFCSLLVLSVGCLVSSRFSSLFSTSPAPHLSLVSRLLLGVPFAAAGEEETHVEAAGEITSGQHYLEETGK